MDKLYIIGNGFDVAHGIPTTYWSFRTYLEEHNPEFLLFFEKLYDIEPLDDTEPWYSEDAQERWNKSVNNELWSIFEEVMGHPNISSMEDFSSSVLDDMDLETGNIGIRDTMDDYWKNEFGFVNELQGLVNEWISKIDLLGILPKKKGLIRNSNDYFFTFNYTNTLEDVYHVENVMHIHGSIGESANYEPIMGHCNKTEIDKHRRLSYEADEEYDEGGASINSAISDYLEAIFKDTTFLINCHYHYFSSLSSVKHVIIVGWSAGDVDIPYLKKIKECVCAEAKWTAYFFNDFALNSIKEAFEKTGITDKYKTEFLPTSTFWDK